ncbi:TonB-dependent receptor [Gramella jeungdoensis]|uniref:TonB-dependent receptor n=1 Tax=Gramella jeungdoensis TaxID=708091 RepID=A0ABT0Z3N9_9FLAO|nr:TonB-dependent receptor [Gramella jeungdoensis]
MTDSETGTPIPGVNILEKNTTNGVMTNFDGEYTIQVATNAILEFSFLGYGTKDLAVNGNNTINVTLSTQSADLDEIVVVGYSSKKKSDITSSVSEVDGDELTDVTSPDVSTMLQGKASGVQIVQGSGQPGSTPAIRIRGLSSINGSVSPLWVVDGMIVHGTPNLNPNEIKSISVLKDASATALYGSRGANGVVVVTTNQGTSGVDKLNLSSRVGFSYLNQGNFEVMNSQEMYDYYQNFSNQDAIPEGITEDVLNNDFDWINNGTQTGVVQDHNITFTGGKDNSKTFISLGLYDETGAVKGFDYNRLSFRLNHDYEVSERFTLKPKIAVNYSTRFSQQHSLYQMYLNMPWDSAFDEEGGIIDPQNPEVVWYGRDRSNYLYDLQWNYSESNELNGYGNFDFEYELTDNLRFISTNGITYFSTNGKSYTDPASNSGLANNGALSEYGQRRITTFTNQMLKYSNVWDKHTLGVLAAYEYNDYQYESTSATGYGIISGTEILNNAATPAAVGGFKNEYALQSILFNADYSYDERYLTQFSIRRDGASNFGENHQYGTFYSGSLGWNLHNESFFQADDINQFKLRVSYGSVGNRPSSLYPQYGLYNLNNTYNGYPATTPSQLGNDDLSWEKSYQTNIGLDTRFFDKLSVSIEYYNKDTSDLLYFVSLPSTTGYTGYWENIGGVKNNGFEGNIAVDIVSTENVFLSATGNIGFNTNEVTELFEDQQIDRGTKISKVGEDFNSWFMRKWLGVDPETGNPLWEVVNPETGERSETTDYNAATKQIVGTSSPDFYGGFGTNFQLREFTLTTNFAFSYGGEIYNSSRELYDADGAYPTYNQQVLAEAWTRWEEPGDIATHPRLVYGGNNLSNKTSSRYLEDGSYLRLRNIRAGYTIPQNLSNEVGLSNAEVYISGDNLLTLTGYSGMDPEVGADGFSSTLYPVSKKLIFGVNLTF